MREQYLQMRRSNQFNFGWFFDYFVSESGKNMPFPVFQQAFNMYFGMNQRDIFEFLDKKFEVQKVEDPHGQLLYIN